MYERKTPSINTHRSTTASTTTASTTKSPTPIKRGTRQRTGRAPLTSATNQQQQQLGNEQKQTQRRIAARAATAMDQIRRRQPRSYMLWGDNRKAVIKRYPDGAQEIMVPQTLTPEQEQYEFPPRSRLLKKLATSTAERHRLSSLQYNITTAPTVPPPLSLHSHETKPTLMTNMTRPHPTSVMELDQGTLAEWFSGKQQQHSRQTHSAKEKAVMDWMTDVERSTSLVKKSAESPIKQHPNDKNSQSSIQQQHQATPIMHDINIHFKSEAGKLVASGQSCQKSFHYLSPPNEDIKKHYVRLHRLHTHSNKPRKTTTTTTPTMNQTVRYQPYVSASSSSYQHKSSLLSPKSNVVRLAQMFHKTLQDQQARAHKRMQQFESLLEDERHKRQDIQRTQQRTVSQLDSIMKKYQEQRRIPPSPILSTTTTTSSSSPAPVSPSWVSILSSHSSSSSLTSALSRNTGRQDLDGWMERITRLEMRIQHETKSRQALQQTVANTVQWMDGLKASLSAQALEHSLSQRRLEKRINEALNKLSDLTQQRNGG